jgi:hypothetical protein
VTLALRNEGGAALTLGVPAVTGPGRAAFRLEPGGCTSLTMLAPGAGCTISLAATAPVPQAVPERAVAPSPSPVSPPVGEADAVRSGGGCSRVALDAATDPLWPGLVAWAALMLARRARA